MPHRLNAADPDFATQFDAFLALKREADSDVRDSVAAIITDVRDRGDDALIELTEKFDRFNVKATGLRVGDTERRNARREINPDVIAALELAADRIQAFHENQRPEGIAYADDAGVSLGYRWTAIDAAGLYVPGGRAVYPSSVLMNAIPAKVAGVDRIAMVVPTPDGVLNPLLLAAADIAGISEIYRVGGAQAVAALAYGTEKIAPVDKITGPGNAWVAEAKRQVYGRVGIDSIAGPSEICVLSDADSDPAWIAADLLSQAEHDDVAQSVLITDSEEHAAAVEAALADHLARLPRAEIARASWERYGAIILVEDLMDAVDVIDRIAPEHLELAVQSAEAFAMAVSHAGAIFIGRYTPEAIGDYVAGPNHVLPTSQSARFSSGLSVLDFMKRTTLVSCDEASLAQIGPSAVTLAEAEGLGAHALSVALRLGQ